MATPATIKQIVDKSCKGMIAMPFFKDFPNFADRLNCIQYTYKSRPAFIVTKEVI